MGSAFSQRGTALWLPLGLPVVPLWLLLCCWGNSWDNVVFTDAPVSSLHWSCPGSPSHTLNRSCWCSVLAQVLQAHKASVSPGCARPSCARSTASFSGWTINIIRRAINNYSSVCCLLYWETNAEGCSCLQCQLYYRPAARAELGLWQLHHCYLMQTKSPHWPAPFLTYPAALSNLPALHNTELFLHIPA